MKQTLHGKTSEKNNHLRRLADGPRTLTSPRLESSLRVPKRSQLFICLHNEMLPATAVRVGNPDRPPFRIHGRHAAPTPSGFTKIISDGFPVFHRDLHADSFSKIATLTGGNSRSSLVLRRKARTMGTRSKCYGQSSLS
jgi:hypothetical protein